MKRQILLIIASLIVIGASVAVPASAANPGYCGDYCRNMDQCNAGGCILCVHAIIPDSSKCG